MKKTITKITSSLLIMIGLGANAQTVLYNQDFEGGSFPSTWTQTTAATDGGWLWGSALSSASWAIPAHGNYVATNDDGCNCVKNNDFLNFTAPTGSGWGYCVFGKVTAGMDVIDKIGKVKTASKAGHQDVPVEPVIIESATRI